MSRIFVGLSSQEVTDRWIRRVALRTSVDPAHNKIITRCEADSSYDTVVVGFDEHILFKAMTVHVPSETGTDAAWRDEGNRALS